MSPVAAPRRRAPARFRVYLSSDSNGLYFVIDTFADQTVAGPFFKESIARQWIAGHA